MVERWPYVPKVLDKIPSHVYFSISPFYFQCSVRVLGAILRSLAQNISLFLGIQGYTVTRYIAGYVRFYDLIVSLQCAELASGFDPTINCRLKGCGGSLITLPPAHNAGPFTPPY